VTTPDHTQPRSHASPHCGCGVNDIGQPYVDPICARLSDPVPDAPPVQALEQMLHAEEAGRV
jgi:hypothetical protein